jgi:hypothetical protein
MVYIIHSAMGLHIERYNVTTLQKRLELLANDTSWDIPISGVEREYLEEKLRKEEMMILGKLLAKIQEV